ncbi:hypothetical protein MFIFM68171_08444 [Madurella fahalii]|uniref:Uncharacterized protein n=1 Tax=Madurella fahalii TaxID=1157608 RepID=A0ABQ0GKE9_9PEZI
MRALTTSDVAFLLCTVLQRPPPSSLTLTTDIGLRLTLHPDGTISVSLNEPPSPFHSPGNSKPRSMHFTRAAASESTSIDAILLKPVLHTPPLTPTTSHGKGRGCHRYRIAPPLRPHRSHSLTLAAYISYAPDAAPIAMPTSTSASAAALRGRDLVARYDAAWCGAFGEWAEWSERARARTRAGPAQTQAQAQGPAFGDDEGARMLWMVEGLLLACWLSLQADVGAVEYAPGLRVGSSSSSSSSYSAGQKGAVRVYVLEKDAAGIGAVVRRFLRDLVMGMKG